MFPTFQYTTLYTNVRCQFQDWFILCLISLKLAAHIRPNGSYLIHLTRGKLVQHHSKFINKFFCHIQHERPNSVVDTACGFCPGDWSSTPALYNILGKNFLVLWRFWKWFFTISKHNLWLKIVIISLNGITNAIEVDIHTFILKTHF